MDANEGSNSESSRPSEFHSIAVEESQYVLNRQFEAVNDLSNFSFEMLKLNIVLVGALLSAVPLGDQLGIPAR